MSPALALGHEMAHARHPWIGFVLGFLSDPGRYDTLEERRVTKGAETAAAHTLGEPTRASHECNNSSPVPDVTWHTPVVYPPPPPPRYSVYFDPLCTIMS